MSLGQTSYIILYLYNIPSCSSCSTTPQPARWSKHLHCQLLRFIHHRVHLQSSDHQVPKAAGHILPRVTTIVVFVYSIPKGWVMLAFFGGRIYRFSISHFRAEMMEMERACVRNHQPHDSLASKRHVQGFQLNIPSMFRACMLDSAIKTCFELSPEEIHKRCGCSFLIIKLQRCLFAKICQICQGQYDDTSCH